MVSLLCDEAFVQYHPLFKRGKFRRGKLHCLYPERGGLPLPSVCLSPWVSAALSLTPFQVSALFPLAGMTVLKFLPAITRLLPTSSA